MNFHRMHFIMAPLGALLFATRAAAVSLVVMATNTTAVPGAKVYTIGVNVRAVDVADGGIDPVLSVSHITFLGNGISTLPGASPGQQPGSINRPTVQDVQTSFIDVSAKNAGGPPLADFANEGNSSAVARANAAFYQDSWWYVSNDGLLRGVVDAQGDMGVVTTNPASDGSGVYTLGAPNTGTTVVGSTGYVFRSFAYLDLNPVNPTAGQTMSGGGIFGQEQMNYWSPGSDPSHVLGNMLIANGGSITVPLLQIVTSQSVPVPSNWLGDDTYISLGYRIYNVLGTNPFIDPHAILDYNTNTIHALPEPSTCCLAMASVVLLAARGARRKRSSAPAVH